MAALLVMILALAVGIACRLWLPKSHRFAVNSRKAVSLALKGGGVVVVAAATTIPSMIIAALVATIGGAAFVSGVLTAKQR